MKKTAANRGYDQWPASLKKAFKTPIKIPEAMAMDKNIAPATMRDVMGTVEKLGLLAKHYDLEPAAPNAFMILVRLCADIFPGFSTRPIKSHTDRRVRTTLNEATFVFLVEMIMARDKIGSPTACRKLLREFPHYMRKRKGDAAESLRTRYKQAKTRPDVAEFVDQFHQKLGPAKTSEFFLMIAALPE